MAFKLEGVGDLQTQLGRQGPRMPGQAVAPHAGVGGLRAPIRKKKKKKKKEGKKGTQAQAA